MQNSIETPMALSPTPDFWKDSKAFSESMKGGPNGYMLPGVLSAIQHNELSGMSLVFEGKGQWRATYDDYSAVSQVGGPVTALCRLFGSDSDPEFARVFPPSTDEVMDIVTTLMEKLMECFPVAVDNEDEEQ